MSLTNGNFKSSEDRKSLRAFVLREGILPNGRFCNRELASDYKKNRVKAIKQKLDRLVLVIIMDAYTFARLAGLFRPRADLN